MAEKYPKGLDQNTIWFKLDHDEYEKVASILKDLGIDTTWPETNQEYIEIPVTGKHIARLQSILTNLYIEVFNLTRLQ